MPATETQTPINVSASFFRAERLDSDQWNLWCDVSLDGGKTWHHEEYGCIYSDQTGAVGFRRAAHDADEWYSEKLFGAWDGEQETLSSDTLDLACALDDACEAICAEWKP